ncbi:MAG: hypothetical protein ACOCUL_00475 [Bacteroidota bacterium]
MRSLFVIGLLYFIFFSLSSWCRTENESPGLPNIEIRQADQVFFETYRNDKDFNYQKDFVRNKGFFSRLLNWIINKLDEMESVIKVIPLFYKILMGVFILVFLFVAITKTKVYRLFYTQGKVTDIPFIEQDLIEQDVDFDKHILNEINLGNFRNAIRLLYVKLLYLLENKKIISYSKEKTNKDYLLELQKKTSFSKDFQKAADVYEYVWYGNFTIDKPEFDWFKDKFNQLYQEINA